MVMPRGDNNNNNNNNDDSNDFYPIILTAPQSDSCGMDLDELLPIERNLLNSTSSLPSCKPHREVSFGGKDAVVYIESSEDWSDEERDNTWFTAYELERIKKRAIKLCKQEFLGQQPISPDEDSTRGMGIYFPARKEAHAGFVCHVLLAYYEQYPANPEHVAHLAEKWSQANKEIAHTVAVRDMYEAYFPHMLLEQQMALNKKNKMKNGNTAANAAAVAGGPGGIHTPSSHASLSPTPTSHAAVTVNPTDFFNRH